MQGLNEKLCVLIKIALKFVPKGPIENRLSLVQIYDGKMV